MSTTLKVPTTLDGFKEKLARTPVLKEEETTSVQKKSIIVDSPVNYEQVKLAKDKLVQRWEKNGNVHAAIALKNNPFTFDNLTFAFEVENELILEQLNDFRGELLTFLREECQNSTIQLKIGLNTQEAPTVNKLYTPKDKLNFLIEKYPMVGKLKEELKLDTDF